MPTTFRGSHIAFLLFKNEKNKSQTSPSLAYNEPTPETPTFNTGYEWSRSSIRAPSRSSGSRAPSPEVHPYGDPRPTRVAAGGAAGARLRVARAAGSSAPGAGPGAPGAGPPQGRQGQPGAPRPTGAHRGSVLPRRRRNPGPRPPGPEARPGLRGRRASAPPPPT